jgi:hypothetical protein
MHDQGGARKNEQNKDFCWGALVARVLHPIDVQIIEALRWIDAPLSAGDFAQLFDGEPSWSKLCHHLRRLSQFQAIEYAVAPTPRNVTDISYRLVRHSDGG